MEHINTMDQQDESDLAKYFQCSTFSDHSDKNLNRTKHKSKITISSSANRFAQGSLKHKSSFKENLPQLYVRKQKARKQYQKINTVDQETDETNKTKTSPLKSIEDIVLHDGILLKSNTNISSNFGSANIEKCNSIGTSVSSVSNATGVSIEAPSVLNAHNRCKLASWGLPQNILQRYEERGVSDMFTWQVECLSNYHVLQEGKNLVYSAPTSAGKTLVAEILLMKTVLERQKKVIFILPFVSVVREKMYYFRDLLCDSGVRVEGFMGGITPSGGFAATHVAIATIEKANSLINRLMEEKDLAVLGAVIVDELHLLGDPHRGYLLELLLTKLKYMTIRDSSINIQIIGMSATLQNLPLLAKWLDAELYETSFRPVPLNECCKVGKSLYNNEFKLIRDLEVIEELKEDTDDILQLCMETISDGHSVLIFCPTKNWCEQLARQIAKTFFNIGQKNTPLGNMLRKQLNTQAIIETLEQLKHCPIGLDNILKGTISFGIAFHHAGLTMDERDIIEGSFRCGTLRVLVATSTLSSGVNLPARRVIVRCPIFYGKLLDALTYKQMIGRAGRMGKDTSGESILVCKPNERNAAISLLSSSLDPIQSCLEEPGPLMRALLEAVASEVVYTEADLELYIKCTLISFSEEENNDVLAKEAIKFLLDNEFLLLQRSGEEQRWVATPLGKACLAASVSPRDGLFLFEELQKARRCFVLDTELHIIYLVTPVNSGSMIGVVDWMTFLEQWKTISESERRVGQLVGVSERFLMSAITGIIKSNKTLDIHKRFYTALALHDLVREVPLGTVCQKYGCNRGVLQSLQQSAAAFAGMVTQFCKQLGWDCIELLVGQFQARLQFGVCRELLDLLRLPMLNGLRARSLYKEGITCVADLATANEFDVERALHKALPFESGKEYEGEREFETERRNKMRTVFVTGKDGLTPRQAAIMLVQEARILLQNELKLQDISWSRNNQSATSHASYTREANNTDASTVSKNNINRNSEMVPLDNSNNNIDIQFTTPQNRSTGLSQKSKENVRDHQLSSTHNTNVDGSNHFKERNIESLGNDNGDAQEIFSERISDCFLESSDMDSPVSLKKQEEKNCSISLISSASIKIRSIRTRSQSRILKTFGTNITSNLDSSKKIKLSCTDAIKGTQEEKADEIKTSSFTENRSKILNSRSPGYFVESQKKFSNSRSPSLFDESLNLDTQVCNALEQNVFDTFQVSEFDSKCFKSFMPNNSKSRHSGENKKRKLPETENLFEIKNLNNSYNKNTIVSWKEDSWDESKEVFKKVNQLNEGNVEEANEDTTSKRTIRSIKNKSQLRKSNEISTSTPDMKHDTIKDIKNIRRSQRLSENSEIINSTPETIDRRVFKSTEKTQRKRSIQEIVADGSPIANLTLFNRRLSVDSNKSDSDDIILSSQTVDSPSNIIQNRTKLRLQSLRKTQTQKVISNVKKLDEPKPRNESNTLNKSIVKLAENNLLNGPDSSESKSRSDSMNDLFDEDFNIDTNSKVNSENDVAIKNQIFDTSQSYSTKKVTDPEVHVYPHRVTNCLKKEKPDWNTLNIVKIGSDRDTFNHFKIELANKTDVSLALHCERYTSENVIGSKIIERGRVKKRSKKSEEYFHEDKKIFGVAISWSNNVAYYISFENTQECKVSGKEQLNLLKELLSNSSVYIRCYSSKEIFKLVYKCCGIIITSRLLDPITADWLLNGDVIDRTYNDMVLEYFADGNSLMKRIGLCYDCGPGLNVKSELLGQFRSSAEAILTWNAMETLMDQLKQLSPTLLYTFKEIEMRTISILACMELNGLGVSLKALRELSSIISEEMSTLQEHAYVLAGKKFNFSSSKEVSQVLGFYKGKKTSTSKAVLEQCKNPISNLIMSWRKLNMTQTKIIYPLLNLAQYSSRIHGNCVTCTSTGRISMHEPNLQTVPKDFHSEDKSFVISLRMAFIPIDTNVMLSADYCQLELRILAHFSRDTTLCNIMQQEGDIFKSIAAKWNHVTENEVDDTMRQRTKQLCYGMIYGMGAKSLATNLMVTELEAKEFLKSFMDTYPNIRRWLDDTVSKATEDGYVVTLMDRRRILPGLTNSIPSVKSQADRQAINTKVQGSAADIAKKAMIDIEDRMRHEFPQSPIILRDINCKRNLRSSNKNMQLRGGYLVLQLHDEFLYEVNLSDLPQVAVIIKESMEQVCRLMVPLPVKIKVGPAWGQLTEYSF